MDMIKDVAQAAKLKITDFTEKNLSPASLKRTARKLNKKLLKKIQPFMETLLVVSGVLALLAAALYIAGDKE